MSPPDATGDVRREPAGLQQGVRSLDVALLREVIDLVPAGICVLELEDAADPASFRIVLLNATSSEVLGVAPELLLGKTVGEAFPSLLHAGLAEVLRTNVQAGSALDLGSMEYGDERVARGQFDARTYPLGERHVLVLFERLVGFEPDPGNARRVADAVDEALIRCDLDGTVVEWTASAERIYELSPTSTLGRPLTEVVRPEQPQEIDDALRLVRSRVRSHHLRSRQTRGPGAPIVVEMTFTPVRDRSGEVAGVTVVVRDTTALTRLQESLEFVLESAGLGYWDFDIPSNRTTRSLTHDRLFGYDELLPHWGHDTFLAHLHPDDRARVEAAFKDTLRRDGQDRVEFRVVWPDGSLHWLSGRGHVVRGTDGSPLRVLGVLGDVTEGKQAELAAFETAHLFSSLVDSMGDAVIGSTPDGVITSWNRAAEGLFGWTEEEMVGRELSLLAPADLVDESSALRDAVAQGETLRDVETVRRCRDGSLVEVALTVSPQRDSEGAVISMTGIVRDITDHRRLESELKHQAMHDALTGLPNRVLLGDRLGHAVAGAARSGLPVAVLVLDLDGFKTVNDAAGHAVGDQLLVETAGRLVEVLRPEDSIARLGGDEFVVVCEHTDAAVALDVADRLHAALAEPVEIEGQRFSVTISVGVAVSASLSAEALLRSADTAMYDAKAAGRARTSLFTTPMAARAQSRLGLSLELREAIAADKLEVHYQPVVDLLTGRMLGVEALARWHHPDHGLIPAPAFIAIAEETGLITALDRWVIGRACRDGATMVASGLLGPEGHVAVNVAARDISDGAIGPIITRAVAGAGPRFDYRQLVVEVTETGVMADSDTARRILEDLRDLGVAVALDDFGTGYSSLTYLQRLPISVLKIDLSFVGRITEHEDNLAIAASIVHLAASLGMRTVAEGVETTEQLVLLQRMGCVAGQGWLWSEARSLDSLTEVLLALPQQTFAVC